MSSNTPTEPPGNMLGIALVLAASLGFASKAIFIKLSYQVDGSIDAITVMALRMLLALPFFLITALFYRRRQGQSELTRGDYARILYLGFMGYYLSSYLDLSGLHHISAGLERLILYLYPTFVVLLSAYLSRRRVRQREVTALLLSYLGIAMVFYFELGLAGDSVLTGSLLVTAAAFSFALFMIGSHGAVRRIGAARFTAYSMTVATLLTLGHYLAVHGVENLRQPAPFYLYGLNLAMLGTVLPAFMMNAGLQRVGASSTAILGSIGPIMTLGLAYLYLGEPLTPLQLGGTLLILAGVYAASRRGAGA
jgi:drug/metabolite transporter (DMT)-like permease